MNRYALILALVLPACSFTNLSGYTGGNTDDTSGDDTSVGLDATDTNTSTTTSTTTATTSTTTTTSTDTTTTQTTTPDTGSLDTGVADTHVTDSVATDTGVADTYKPDTATTVTDTGKPDTATTTTTTTTAGGTFTATWTGAGDAQAPSVAVTGAITADDITASGGLTFNGNSSYLMDYHGWNEDDTTNGCQGADSTEYYQVSVTPTSGTIATITVAGNVSISGTGPTNWGLYYSTDGSNFSSIAYGTDSTTTGPVGGTASGLSATGIVYIQLYACYASSSSGTFRLSSPFTVSGTFQ